MKKQTRIVGDMMQTERRDDGKRFLLRDLHLEIEGDPIRIPAGTITDFSSIPWYGRILVRWSKVDIAGVVHDWCYQTGASSRARADAIWRLVAMAGTYHANVFQAWVGWLALRVGGWIAWNRYRGQDTTDATTAEELGPAISG